MRGEWGTISKVEWHWMRCIMHESVVSLLSNCIKWHDDRQAQMLSSAILECAIWGLIMHVAYLHLTDRECIVLGCVKYKFISNFIFGWIQTTSRVYSLTILNQHWVTVGRETNIFHVCGEKGEICEKYMLYSRRKWWRSTRELLKTSKRHYAHNGDRRIQ